MKKHFWFKSSFFWEKQCLQASFCLATEQRSLAQKARNTLSNQTFFICFFCESFFNLIFSLSHHYQTCMNPKFKPHVSEINTEKNAYRLFVKSLFFLATADGLELYQLSRISWKLGSGSWNAHALAYNTRAGLFSARPFLSTPFSAFVHHHCFGKNWPGTT